eukprot:scaffold1071_cov166-Amphora_coffeaeformis.AAC.13
MADLCRVNEWNIGVNPICYRGKCDKMGKHADNDQGEEVITTAIITQDSPRLLVFEPCPKKFPKDKLETGEEKVVLLLRQGDVYQMDGALQQNYVHSVPPCPKNNSEELGNDDDGRRLAIVFRKGKRVDYPKDNGEPVYDLKPPPKLEYRIGVIEGLQYGGIYKRSELFALRAHQAAQRSISGSIHAGCDALIMSGTRGDGLEWDGFFTFVYAVESRKGAMALVTSYNRRDPVRVFRTNQIDPSIKRGPSQTQFYRYDGLYQISGYEAPDDPTKPFLFFLQMSNLSVYGENGTDSHVPFRKVDFIPEKPAFLVNMGAERITRGLYQQVFREARSSAKDPNSVKDVLLQLYHLFWPRARSTRATDLSTVNDASVRYELSRENTLGVESPQVLTRYTNFRLWNNSVACTREETLQPSRATRVFKNISRVPTQLLSRATLAKNRAEERSCATGAFKEKSRVTRPHPLVESWVTLKNESWASLSKQILQYARGQGMSLEEGKLILEATLPTIFENYEHSKSSQTHLSKRKSRVSQSDLNDNDILSGRGTGHPGNRALRRLVSLNQPFYQARIDSAMKKRCIDAIIGFLESRQVRFLEKTSDSEWAYISYERCVDKLQKALGEKRPYKETRKELLFSVLEDVKQNPKKITKAAVSIEDRANLNPLRIFREIGSPETESKGIQLQEKVDDPISWAVIGTRQELLVPEPCLPVHMWPYPEHRMFPSAEERAVQVLCRLLIDHLRQLRGQLIDRLLCAWLMDFHLSQPVVLNRTQSWPTHMKPLDHLKMGTEERFVSVTPENQWNAVKILRDLSLEAYSRYCFGTSTGLDSLVNAATGLSGRGSEVVVSPPFNLFQDDQVAVWESASEEVEPLRRSIRIYQHPLLTATYIYTAGGTQNRNIEQVQIPLCHERKYEELKFLQLKKEKNLALRSKSRSGAMSQAVQRERVRTKKNAGRPDKRACCGTLNQPTVSVETEDANTVRYGISRVNIIGSESQHVVTRHARMRLPNEQPVPALNQPVVSTETEDANTVRYGISRVNIIGSESQQVVTRHARVRLSSEQPTTVKQSKRQKSALSSTVSAKPKRSKIVSGRRNRDIFKRKCPGEQPRWEEKPKLSFPSIQNTTAVTPNRLSDMADRHHVQAIRTAAGVDNKKHGSSMSPTETNKFQPNPFSPVCRPKPTTQSTPNPSSTRACQKRRCPSADHSKPGLAPKVRRIVSLG